jgi:cytochrome P450
LAIDSAVARWKTLDRIATVFCMTTTQPLPYDEIPMLPDGLGLGPTLLFRRDRYAFMMKLSTGAPLCRVQLFDRKVALVTGALEIQQLLVENAGSLAKSAVQKLVGYPVLGDGLLGSSGELWRKQRKLMAPIFTPAQIAGYGTDMMQCAAREMATYVDGSLLDVTQSMTRLTMSVAGKTLFGADTCSEADEIGRALAVAIRLFGKLSGSPLSFLQVAVKDGLSRLSQHLPDALASFVDKGVQQLESPILFGQESADLDQAVALLDKYVADLIAKRRQSPDASHDLLTRLLAARDGADQMTDKQLRDEVLTLFVAGHETTAVSLSWSLYLLAKHPEIYSDVQQLVDSLPAEPTVADLPKLGKVLRVFKEALRIYPPLPLFSRDTTASIVVGGYEIPAGTPVLIAPLGTHHRPELWPDSQRFLPDRFLPEQESQRHRYAFIPFSAGPRVCIGNHFAMMEAQLVLTTLLRNYEFSLPEGTVVVPEIDSALRPKEGLHMRIKRRTPRPAN